MTSPELANLTKIGKLAVERPTPGEVENLQRSGEARLEDATRPDLSLDGRFDLAYNAAHALALAALRRLGYRSNDRYTVFQVLPHTLGIPKEQWRVLDKGHRVRNQAEYEGVMDLDERLVEDMMAAATVVRDALRKAGSPPGS